MSAKSIRRVAVSTLLAVASDEKAPAAARGAAARSLLELVGDLGAKATPLREKEARDLTELSPAEIEAELREAGSSFPQ